MIRMRIQCILSYIHRQLNHPKLFLRSAAEASSSSRGICFKSRYSEYETFESEIASIKICSCPTEVISCDQFLSPIFAERQMRAPLIFHCVYYHVQNEFKKDHKQDESSGSILPHGVNIRQKTELTDDVLTLKIMVKMSEIIHRNVSDLMLFSAGKEV